MSPRLNEMPRGESIILLVYGRAGCGKSDFLATCGDRSLVYECEGRLGTWQKDEFKKRRGNWNPIIEQITEELIPDGGAKALDRLTKSINTYFEKQIDEFDTVCIDGSTAFRRFAFNKGIELNGTDTLKKAIGERTKAKDAMSIAYTPTDIRDLTAEMQMVSKFIYQLIETCRENKKHLIFTAHERITFEKPSAATMSTPKDEKIHSIYPAFTGQTFPDELPGIFDLVWHFETEGIESKTKYLARTTGDGTIMAKSSVGSDWPVKLYDPNFQKVVEKVRNS